MRRLLALVLTLAVLAACGGGDDGDDGVAEAAEVAGGDDREQAGGQPDGGEVDGCDLLTQDDAAAVLGETPERQADDGLGGAAVLTECTWIVETDTSFKMVLIHLFDGPQFFAPDVYAAEEGFEELDGLGDDAFLWDSQLGLDIQMLVGDLTIALVVSGFNNDDPDFNATTVRERLLAQAQKVVDRL